MPTFNDRPQISPETQGGLSAWMGYLAGKVESIESRQAAQNGTVADLVGQVAHLPCVENHNRLVRLEKARQTDCDRKYETGETRKQNLVTFAIKLAMVVLGAALTFGISMFTAQCY